MAIYITGDFHGNLQRFYHPEIKKLGSDDKLIIVGDFGFIFDGGEKEQRVLETINQFQFETLFIDGNHENFDLLYQYPIEDKYGGKVRKIRDNIYHLVRGEIFTIEEKKFFTFGGALSIDKLQRKGFISWWKQEIPSYSEFLNACNNLDKHGYKVDYVLTHTVNQSTFLELCGKLCLISVEDYTSLYLQELANKIQYKHWFFGHFHKDIQVNDNQRLLFYDIVKV